MTDFNIFENAHIFAVTKKYKSKRGEIKQVDDRFRINAGWVLYKNTAYNRDRLQKIQQEFDLETGKKVEFTFTPHLSPMFRGILTTIYCNVTKKNNINSIINCHFY